MPHTPPPPTASGPARHALALGITGDWAFAAATVLAALARHSPALLRGADVLLYAATTLPAHDHTLLEALGAHILPPPDAVAGMSHSLTPDAVRVFSPMCVAKFHCFTLLERYDKVLWLDTDTLIQGDIAPLFTRPLPAGTAGLALAREDPAFADPPGVQPASINIHTPIAALDGNAPNRNSGVILFDRSGLDDPAQYAEWCVDFVCRHGSRLRYPDQAAFNALLHTWQRQGRAVAELGQEWNTHPRNPRATFAPIVHAFGAYKLWNDGLTAVCFPEWQRDYARWLAAGGTPYRGRVDNAAYLEGGAFALLQGLHDTIGKAEAAIHELQRRLHTESAARARLEAVLRKQGETLQQP